MKSETWPCNAFKFFLVLLICF
jgi:hypothetical protein